MTQREEEILHILKKNPMISQQELADRQRQIDVLQSRIRRLEQQLEEARTPALHTQPSSAPPTPSVPRSHASPRSCQRWIPDARCRIFDWSALFAISATQGRELPEAAKRPPRSCCRISSGA